MTTLNIIDLTFQRILQFNPIHNGLYLLFRIMIVKIVISHYLGGLYYAIDLYIY